MISPVFNVMEGMKSFMHANIGSLKGENIYYDNPYDKVNGGIVRKEIAFDAN